MFKRFLALFLAIILALTVTACSSQEDQPNRDQDTSLTDPDQPGDGQPENDEDAGPDNDDAPAAGLPEGDDSDAPPPSENGGDDKQPDSPPNSTENKPNQPQKPAETPDKQPDPQPDSSQDSFTIDDIWAEIQSSTGDSLPSLSAMDAETLTTLYPLSTGDLAEYGLYLSPIGVQATEIFIVKAASDKVETVKSAITSRQADLVAQWENYLPEQLTLVQNYKLVTNGDYILFCIAEKADDIVDIFNSYTK